MSDYKKQLFSDRQKKMFSSMLAVAITIVDPLARVFDQRIFTIVHNLINLPRGLDWLAENRLNVNPGKPIPIVPCERYLQIAFSQRILRFGVG